jgi:hypothetical protein
MELTFNKTINGWVAEFNAPTHFNLHLERKDAGRLDLYRKASGSNYVRIPYKEDNKIVDIDVPVVMSRDYKVLCGSRPSMMIVTFADGTILEAIIPSEGGAPSGYSQFLTADGMVFTASDGNYFVKL